MSPADCTRWVARPTASATAATLNPWIDTAPVYRVSKTADAADGVCDLDCSLREAVEASNAAPGAVVIPAGTYALTRAGLDDDNSDGDLDAAAASYRKAQARCSDGYQRAAEGLPLRPTGSRLANVHHVA